MGLATCSDYVDWAVSELVAGVDTPNLRILAGLPKPPYRPEVELYFERTLDDMGCLLPEREACLLQYVRGIAQAIVSGDTPPLEGCCEIYRILAALGYPASLWSWVYLSEGLEPGVYHELEDSELEAAIRREAERLLEDADAP